MTDITERANTTEYSTYIFELWIIFFKMGETDTRKLTAEEIAKVWNEAKFGNLGRGLGSIVLYPFTILSYICMKRAQSKARKSR
jgi:hypothetical protein